MGQSVKVTTKTADSPYVHELALVAAELEQRYKDSKVRNLAKCSFQELAAQMHMVLSP